MADNPFDQFDPKKLGDPESFKKEYYPAAQMAGKELDVDPDILLGKWGNETGWGKSIVPGTNNLGNIKGKGVAAKDNATGSTDEYKKYGSTKEFVDDYVDLIKRKYPKAVGAKSDASKFTAGLKGYAEDPAYPSKVKASAQLASKAPAPKNLFDQFDETKEVSKPTGKSGTPPPEAGTITPIEDIAYKRGSPEKATFGEAVRDVGQAALGLGSSMLGGMAGLGAEVGATALKGMAPIHPPGVKPSVLEKIDPYEVKNKVANALTYEPKTSGAKKLAEIASIPGQVVGYPLEKALEATPQELKPAVDIAGNILMAQAPRMAGAAIRRPLAGNEEARAKTRENIAAFKRAEVSPYTLGQVSEGGLTKEAGAPRTLIEQQKDQLAARAERVADRMSQVRTTEEAGKIAKEAIQGEMETKQVVPRKGAAPVTIQTGKKIGGYIDNIRSQEEALHDKAETIVGKNTQIWFPKLFSTLKDLTSQRANLPATSGSFISRGLLDLRERLVDDTGRPKKLTYEDAKWLRHKIGELTDPRQIVPNDTSRVAISPAQADALYAAISEDMIKGVARQGPRAEIAVQKANQFSRGMHKEISDHLQPVLNTKQFTDAFNAATSGTREGAERVRTTMKTLDPTQKDAVKSVFFRELGRKGDAWDMKQFMDNYNKLHPEAKNELFGSAGRNKFRNDLDTIAKVADKLTVDENTWHKLKSFMLTGGKLGTMAAAGAVAGVVTHSMIPVFLAGPAAGFVTGNLVRNPRFIDWFAKASTKTKASSIPPLLSNLQQRTKDMSPEDKQEVDDYINKVQENLGAPNESPAR